MVCPFLLHPPNPYPGLPNTKQQHEYIKALQEINWYNVKEDLQLLFHSNQDWWPADYGHYGSFFIRMAWHATGTYRESDGRGGSDGGCQRYEPELSWDDNTNLIYAHLLLQPIKNKYGLGLSWGDLFVLAGTIAIQDMGGPILGFAAGRIDHINNAQSIGLGPSSEQEQFASIQVNGQAPAPLGQNTMGLIYVNPAGPMGIPDPQGAADTIRDVFGRMGMNDRENVALIGGGHTFGKCHGAANIPNGAGLKPSICPHAPYRGLYRTGKGNDTITSGFEGSWTTNPTRWDNEYYKNLLNYKWEVHKGPGGQWQWRVQGGNSPQAPMAHGHGTQDIMMLTTDIALVTDPIYRIYVEEFANDQKAFDDAFASVWYKLTHRDVGPVTRLLGPMVPPPQDWQYPLPDPPINLANMDAVEKHLNNVLLHNESMKHELIRLAMNSASTFRHTDYLGGCNGARIRFHLHWENNEGLDVAIQFLEPVQRKFRSGLSWADLIVLAGNVCVKQLGAPKNLPFVGGRTDATDGAGWDALAYINASFPKSIEDVTQRNTLQGLSSKEYVALAFPYFPTTRSLKQLLEFDDERAIDNNYTCKHRLLVASTLKHGPYYQRWVEYYIHVGDTEYKKDFASTWTKIMNVDRFAGPVKNAVLIDIDSQSRL